MCDFGHPSAFFLLACVPLLFILRKLKLFSRIAFPIILSDWQGKPFIWKKNSGRFLSACAAVLATAGFCALVTALADPVKHHSEYVYTSRGADIYLVLDTSPSMGIKDIAGMSRLDAARQAVHLLVEQNEGTSFGLVAMSSQAAVVLPATTDHELFLDRLDKLIIGELGTGSAIGTGLSTAVYHLAASPAPKKCIILITDGENNAGSIHPETAAALAARNDISLYLLGIGTQGVLPLEYVDPESGKVSFGYREFKFDVHVLEQIAAAGNGRYFGVQHTGDLLSVVNLVAKHEKVNQTYQVKIHDEYYYDRLLIVAAACFILAWCIRRVHLKEIV